MCNAIIIYQPNYNVLPGTDDYYVEQQKYVRMACYHVNKERNGYDYKWLCLCMYTSWPVFRDLILTDFGLKNWSLQFYYKVKLQIPRLQPSIF